ncbi:DUF4381 family protein [Aeromonas lusitana]|uniref:DUF4381 domain-containing protein n=1 Tax=Aeromonas lusitana TaxID=931529 RepID=A0A2M8HE23_9GAMM|nr:DUF4381 family protein [Aeromonas lusitana]PJC94780.1 DUF4381 domain-containing protein [Aeromonas lusitana]
MPSALIAAQASSLPATQLHEIQAQLRDIHPGPALTSATDPRLLALGWLLIALLGLLLIILLTTMLWRQRRWARQIAWQEADLVPRLQSVLRTAALTRWPEARSLQGDAWLIWLDEKGGSRFRELAAHWPDWLYGQQVPDEKQRAQLKRAYLRWGRRCVSAPSLMRPGPGRQRRTSQGERC